MDFSFYIGYQRDTGLSLWDIRYKGQRVLYELGLQEALAHYAGQDPLQSGTAYVSKGYHCFGQNLLTERFDRHILRIWAVRLRIG